MPNFKEIIHRNIKQARKENDKRIMKTALDIIVDEPILSDESIDVLNEIFMALKLDYTLRIIQDYETLNFAVEIYKQEEPIIENKHEVNILYSELSQKEKITKLEKCALLFLNACEHTEENEVLVINKILEFIEKNWTLSPIEKYGDTRISKIVPIYYKTYKKTS